MIDKDYFVHQLRNVSHLNNCLVKKEAADLMYNRLRFSELNDFDRAVEDIIEEGERLSYGILKKYITRHMTIRIERENQESKIAEAEEIKTLFANNLPEQPCDYRCSACNKKYCNKVANAAKAAIRSLLSGEKTIDVICRDMSERFPGAGYENGLPSPF